MANPLYTPQKIYKIYKQNGGGRGIIATLSQLATMTEAEVIKTVKDEEARLSKEKSRNDKILDTISELVCDLVSLTEMLGYLRVRGYYKEPDTLYVIRRVEDTMKVGNLIVSDEDLKIIEDAIKTNTRPVKCYNDNNFEFDKKAFQSIWYRVKNKLRDEGKVEDKSVIIDQELAEVIKGLLAQGKTKEECFEGMKRNITKSRFERIYKKLTKAEKSEAAKESVHTELEVIENPKAEESVQAAASSWEPEDDTEESSLDYTYIIDRLVTINNMLTTLIQELKEVD